MENGESSFVMSIGTVVRILRQAADSVGINGEIGYLQFSGGLWYEAWIFPENYREGDLFLSVRLERDQPVSVGVARLIEDCPDVVNGKNCLVNDEQTLLDWVTKYLKKYFLPQED